MNKRKTIGDKLSCKNRESIPNSAFHVMTAVMKLMDLIGKHSAKNFKKLKLKPGQTVIDYGCGPARYVHPASRAVGSAGKVFAVDIHPLAIQEVKRKIKKHKLTNVEPVLADGYNTPLQSETADVVYALDVFHMIEHPTPFLTELGRLLKTDGTLILEDGHQPRNETLSKIQQSGVFEIVHGTTSHVRCRKRPAEV